MRKNQLRELWRAGKPALNGWCSIGNSVAAEVVGHQGWDCVTVDLQHTGIDEATAITMLQALSLGDSVPMVRAPWNEPGVLMRLLDAGAYGVICPMINNRADAENFVAACRYPPDGFRSNGPYRGVLYGGSDYQQHANVEIVLLGMVETREAVANLDEIAATPGLDGIYIGPTDLAMSHGHPPRHDNFDGPVAALITHILAAAKKAGKVAGVHATRTDYAAQMIADGFDLVTPTSDIRLVQIGGGEVIAQLRGG